MKHLFLFLSAFALLTACDAPQTEKTALPETPEVAEITPSEWAKSAVMYEVNMRQYTPEGTFSAFMPHLSRLSNMGVDVLWLMPIHPIGEKNRKGGLGSYYSIKDYEGINPEFGTEADFKALVDSAHALGMEVLIDWVANHSAWDNPWIESNPEFYQTDSTGKMVSPYDWTDVAAFDYENEELRKRMISALKYWVSKFNIDGYRCDVAYMVPTTFWDSARMELDAIKPVYMLAEAETPELHEKAFDIGYTWDFHHAMNACAQENGAISHLTAAFEKRQSSFAETDGLYFITNHDENSWSGTVFERLGDAHLAYATLIFTLDGMPLLYSGQEAGLNKRLAFFEKDTISWDSLPYETFYTQLATLKEEHPALWHGAEAGEHAFIEVEAPSVLAYTRTKGDDQVAVYINFGEEEQSLDASQFQEYKDAFEAKYGQMENGQLTLPAFGFVVLEKQ